MITLHKSATTSNKNLGLGCLDSYIIEPKVHEEINGMFELEFQYPIDAPHFKDIKLRRIIYCKPNPYDKPQPFRIYNITVPINRIITVQATHISYDLSGFVVNPFMAKTARNAFLSITENSISPSGFTFETTVSDPENIEEAYPMLIEEPKNIRSILGEDILENFVGEYVFDNYNVKFVPERGVKRNTKIEYGKNITDINQEVNCANVYTAVYPYWKGIISIPIEEGSEEYVDVEIMVTLPEKIVNVPGDSGYIKILPLDAGDIFTEPPDIELLRRYANDYIKFNNLAAPKISISVSFVDIYKAEGYEELEVLNQVRIGDTIGVIFKDGNIEAKARCISTDYDPLNDEYLNLELGDETYGLDGGIIDVESAAKDRADKDAEQTIKDIEAYYNKAVEEATGLINHGLGGYVIKNRNELLICDTDDIKTAKKIWRWNINGLAYSSNGYGGPYTTAITNQGKFVINEVTAHKFTAALINTGVISSLNGNVQLNVDDDYFSVSHTEVGTRTRLDASGLYIIGPDGDTIASLATEESWSELKAHSVVATNINNIYLGDSHLYVDYDATTAGNGTYDKPFTSFAALMSYLNKTKIIDKTVFIYVKSSKEINDVLDINNFYGGGHLSIQYEKNVVHRYNGSPVTLKGNTISVGVWGAKTSRLHDDGAILFSSLSQTDITAYNRPAVVNIERCSHVSVGYINLDGHNNAVTSINSHAYLDNIDMGKTQVGLFTDGGQVRLNNCIGSCSKNSVISYNGGIVSYGQTSGLGHMPQGSVDNYTGIVHNLGHVEPRSSIRYAPVVPPTSDYTGNFTALSKGTYQYKWGNWASGVCKQGVYGSYGNKAGHLFFSISDLRNWIGTGTVLDGCTITLTRRNAGGSSGATNLYINSSTASGASGTPSYKNRTYLGRLSWGQTATFTLPTAIVNDLKNGSANSIAFYNTSDTGAYIEIVSAKITIRVRK